MTKYESLVKQYESAEKSCDHAWSHVEKLEDRYFKLVKNGAELEKITAAKYNVRMSIFKAYDLSLKASNLHIEFAKIPLNER